MSKVVSLEARRLEAKRWCPSIHTCTGIPLVRAHAIFVIMIGVMGGLVGGYVLAGEDASVVLESPVITVQAVLALIGLANIGIGVWQLYRHRHCPRT
ncbi:MAG TPA: hypothetical protein VJJ22_04490 [Candidatus Paceibacterota bacterium]